MRISITAVEKVRTPLRLVAPAAMALLQFIGLALLASVLLLPAETATMSPALFTSLMAD